MLPVDQSPGFTAVDVDLTRWDNQGTGATAGGLRSVVETLTLRASGRDDADRRAKLDLLTLPELADWRRQCEWSNG